jgi:uncharacterized protein YjbI with pentapeptide repeats
VNDIYIEGKKFEKTDFTENALAKGEYGSCVFINCNFSNADLSGINFSECEFTGCNLTLAKTSKTSFINAKFRDCKLTGLRFDTCNDFLFTADFENCMLNISSFYKLKIKKIKFKSCMLHEADFTEADLSGSLFENCDLARAIFQNTILEKADFRSAYNYSLDPGMNKVKKAKFSTAGLVGLLDKYDIDVE